MDSFDRIIGYKKEKAELKQIADTLINREIYHNLGVKPPSGLLLNGIPGVGKTLMAESLIESTGLPVLVCRKDKTNAEFIKAIKTTFEKALEKAPAIVFLDDLDKFANSDYTCRDAEEFVVVQTCIDENKGKGIFVLATCNDAKKLPPSLSRTGRFDRIINLDTPSLEDSIGIIEHYLSNIQFISKETINTNLLARLMDGSSCATLETVINEAGIIAGMKRDKTIEMRHILDACLKVIMDSSVKGDNEDEYDYFFNSGTYDRMAVAVHEIGHVIVSEELFPGSVTAVAITDGNNGTSGFTSCYYHDERDINWKRASIMTGLGGMVATEYYYGRTDIGNGMDIDQVFKDTRKLISYNCALGFDKKDFNFNMSNIQKNKIEETTSIAVEMYYRKVREIIVRNQRFFNLLVEELVEKGILIDEDIKRIKEECIN